MQKENCDAFSANEASWLISAATRKNLNEKAAAVGANIAIFDFEDALAQDQKSEGREVYRLSCRTNDSGVPMAVRINPLASKLGMQDLLFILDNQVVPQKIILPKVCSNRDVDIVAEILTPIRPDLQIYTVVESLEGFRWLREKWHRSAYLSGLHFGAADLAADLRMRLHRMDLDFYRNEIVFAARTQGIIAIDSPCFAVGDEGLLRAECESAIKYGFEGKIAIHPRQVSVINEYFNPTEEDFVYARDIVTRHIDEPIVQVGGLMTGPPFVRYAEAVLNKLPPIPFPSRTSDE